MPLTGHQLISQVKIDASQVTFNARFNEAFNARPDPIREIAMEVPSGGREESYDWLGEVPQLTEWLDERRLDNLTAENISLLNRDYASGIKIHANDFKDDRLGVVGTRVASLGEKAARHYGNEIARFLLAGFGTTLASAYDGVAFFSASHANIGGPTQSNTNSAALSDANYTSARAGMQELRDVFDDELGVLPTHLLVGATQERLALEISQATAIANSAATASIANVFAGTATVLVSPRIRGGAASNWFLLDLSGTVKPMILQVREAITNSFVTDPNGMLVFMKNQLLYGAQGRHAIGYGLWEKAFGSDN